MQAEVQFTESVVAKSANAPRFGLLFLSLVCLALGFYAYFGIAQLVPLEIRWLVAWGTGLAASFLTVVRFRRNDRILASLALACSMAGCWMPIARFYDVNHTYPWVMVGTLAITMIAGGLMCRLRVIPILATLFLLSWFGGTVLPPQAHYPVVKEADGIRCTLKSPQEIDFQAVDGSDISLQIDENNVQSNASIGPLIQTDNLLRRRFTLENAMIHGRDRSFVALNPQVEKPVWSRSVRLQFDVQRWPKVPACEVTIPLKSTLDDSFQASQGEFDLSANQVRWTSSAHTEFQVNLFYNRIKRQTGADARASMYDPTPYLLTGKEYRIIDDRGMKVEPQRIADGVDPIDGAYRSGVSPLLRIGFWSRMPKWIKIQVFNPDDLGKNRTTFDFGRLP